ncbi:RNA polymerase sigma factor [Desulfohalovibrio reitneri]|uniref:RNA polymerase sigma factor n=1 Tax=Desulfohalovibrio reitneri TaxID=1307759 RepID=UPI0004A6FEC4|nr:sigma-70 family RNA polymerase sigma factor [Desulfohalovibrio reitneri]
MNDATAIRLVLAGDTEAFGSFVRRYQRPIYNLMYRAARDEEAAADLTQEAFARAFKGLDGFDANRRFFPWLYAVGVNLARDHARRKRAAPDTVEVRGEDLPASDDSEQELALILGADARAVHHALGELDLEHREALVLRFQEEMTMREIADALEISPSGAKMRVHRGLAKMKRILVENGHEPGTD